jgi:hypothetical protein
MFLNQKHIRYNGDINSQESYVNKLNFHFKLSLKAVYVENVVYWYSIPEDERKGFQCKLLEPQITTP